MPMLALTAQLVAVNFEVAADRVENALRRGACSLAVDDARDDSGTRRRPAGLPCPLHAAHRGSAY